MNTAIEKVPEAEAASERASSLEEQIAALEIADDDGYNSGAEQLKQIKSFTRSVEEQRVAITRPLNESLKRINDLFRAPLEAASRAESALKRKLLAYADKKAAAAREEQRKAEERARLEREKLERQAAKAAEAGKVEKAAALVQRAETVVAPIMQSAPPKVASLSSRSVWKFEVTDASAVPREFLVVDERKIRGVVQALKGDAKIPGVRVYEEKAIASGAV